MKTVRILFVTFALLSLINILSSCCGKKELAKDLIWRPTIVYGIDGNRVIREPYLAQNWGIDPQTKDFKKVRKMLQDSWDNTEVVLIGVKPQQSCGEGPYIVAAKKASDKEKYKYLKTSGMFHTSYMKNPSLNKQH